MIEGKTMRTCILLAMSVMTASGCATASQHGGGPVIAQGEFHDASGMQRGTVTVHQQHDGAMHLSISVDHLAPGQRGAHIHEVGQCSGPAFASAGAHWNPDMRQHGINNPMGSHRGDLPQIMIEADGTGRAEMMVPGPAADLFDSDGASVVIHAAADDNVTDPSGNSGARELCAVLTPMNRM